MTFDYTFWGIKDYAPDPDRDLLGVVKAKDLAEALGIAEMFMPDIKALGYRRVDIQFCIKDFEAKP